ncbi:hypothetical protein M431DRAFT_324743 [Trichoderma harzianum CBS 226.95]|uniref:Uncharacterized protein n=1 Tax=Trichoderma harzianum CBS 226.95 TaxID=983964 RepID=A0A2T3ZUL4_TRIHA|nr:hypothetical protein M431DRAFT_324743 [Trichoderma harzianum CBS 226.95]PTB48510.1 hypothetical protein M431DRAFT_324743 [Trichoderma harzianum CBS 226.95]
MLSYLINGLCYFAPCLLITFSLKLGIRQGTPKKKLLRFSSPLQGFGLAVMSMSEHPSLSPPAQPAYLQSEMQDKVGAVKSVPNAAGNYNCLDGPTCHVKRPFFFFSLRLFAMPHAMLASVRTGGGRNF